MESLVAPVFAVRRYPFHASSYEVVLHFTDSFLFLSNNIVIIMFILLIISNSDEDQNFHPHPHYRATCTVWNILRAP